MFVVDKFLCCMELETGGMIIGWFGAIGSILGAVNLAIPLLAMVLVVDAGYYFYWFQLEFILFIIMAILYSLFLMGMKKRDHNCISQAIVANILGCFISLVSIKIRVHMVEQTLGEEIAIAIIVITSTIYLIIVLYSLYVKFRDEKERPQPVQSVLVTQYVPVQTGPNQQQVYMFPSDQQLQQQQFGQPQQMYNPPPQYVPQEIPQEPEKVKQ